MIFGFQAIELNHEVISEQIKKLWESNNNPEFDCWEDFVTLKMMQQGMSDPK
jgi:hypothetical protein